MNKQESFNYICRKLMAQEEPSALWDKYGAVNCRYRSDAGRCVVGWMIPDTSYRTEYEDTEVDTLLEKYPSLWELTHIRQWTLQELNDLQEAHDNVALRWAESQQDLHMKASWSDYIYDALGVFASRNNLIMEVGPCSTTTAT
jgi:hypothetical protein